MKFKSKKSEIWGTTTHICDSPFVAIREGGDIYLSGDYTIEQLQEIIKFAQQIAINNMLPMPSSGAG